MRKKPVISLLRGNVPKKKTAEQSSPACWRCSENMAKNDPVFEIAGKTIQTAKGYYIRNHKGYCHKCMADIIRKTETDLLKIKRIIGL